MADPFTATILPVINNALKFATTGMETYQARVTAQTRERDRQAEAAQREADRQEARQQYIEARRDKLAEEIRALKAARALDLYRHQLQNYPITNGPGALRESIRLVYNDPRTMPPLVLVVPSHSDGDASWRRLSFRLSSALLPLQAKELIVAGRTDRWVSWPDVWLVENDLYDLPAVIVTAEVADGQLSVALGGCNLGGDRAVRPLSQVALMELPDASYWTEPRLSTLEATSRNGFRRPNLLEDPTAQHLMQLEWATRVSLVAVAAAVDTYHLMRECGYREQLDEAMAQLGPDFEVPIQLSLPEGALADPAYHLLHQARRQLASGLTEAAAETVSESLNILDGYQQLPPGQAILSARSAGRLKPWHAAFLEELAAADGGDVLVPPEVMKALEQSSNGASEPGAVAVQEGSLVPRAGLTVPRTREIDPDAPPGKW